jgi:hypothetical protein
LIFFTKKALDTNWCGVNAIGIITGGVDVAISDGTDQQCYIYYMDTSDKKNNWVKINKQENNYKHIIGEFSATLIKDSDECFLGNPYGGVDTLRIRNGKFDICD